MASDPGFLEAWHKGQNRTPRFMESYIHAVPPWWVSKSTPASSGTTSVFTLESDTLQSLKLPSRKTCVARTAEVKELKVGVEKVKN